MAGNYFCAYHEYLEYMETLSDAEKGRLFVACLQYSSQGTVPEFRGNEKFIFPIIRDRIDRDKKSYQAKCDKNRESVKKRWEKNEEYERIPDDTNVYERIPDDTKNTNLNLNLNPNLKRAKALSKRTRESTPPEIVEKIVEKCNKEWHVKYSADNPAVAKAISERWEKHPDMNDIEYVIEIAGEMWGKDPKMINALTPWIVFNDKNFERFNNALPPDDVAACLKVL